MSGLLYVDTSSLVRSAIGEHDGNEHRQRMRTHLAAGGRLVSSRLLTLEAERVATRFEVVEGRDGEPVRALIRSISLLPLTEEVWQGAHAIRQHIRTLDSIHLATCRLVEADLMTSDAQMHDVAVALGVNVI